jgi:hypothetical protein
VVRGALDVVRGALDVVRGALEVVRGALEVVRGPDEVGRGVAGMVGAGAEGLPVPGRVSLGRGAGLVGAALGGTAGAAGRVGNAIGRATPMPPPDGEGATTGGREYKSAAP